MTELDELAKRRAEQQQTTSNITDGLLQFLGFNASVLLEKTLVGIDFQPMHPSEQDAKAYAVRRPSLQKALYDVITPKVAATVASLPEGSAYQRLDMDDGDNFTVELSRDLRKLPGNPEIVLCAQVTITAFDDKTAGVTRIEYNRRSGTRHDFLGQSGAFIQPHRRT